MEKGGLSKRELAYLQARKIRKFREAFLAFFLVCVLAIVIPYVLFDEGYKVLILLGASVLIWGPLFLKGIFSFSRWTRPLTSEDLKKFGLYLRPFAQDKMGFEDRPLAEALTRHVPGTVSTLSQEENFDRYVAKALCGTEYVWVSIGSPKEKIPSSGSLKIYPSDSSWKFFVRRLVKSSDFILIRCSDTLSFRWELEHLVTHLQQAKLFLYIGMDDGEERFWSEVHQVLTSSGFELSAEFPGRGSLIQFKESGEAMQVGKYLSDHESLGRAIISAMKPEVPPTLPTMVGDGVLEMPASDATGSTEAVNVATAPPSEYYAKLWRQQFVRNPIPLGPPGLWMLLFWVIVIIGSLGLMMVVLLSSEPVFQGRGAAVVIAAMIFGVLYAILQGCSEACARATAKWAAKKGRRLEDIYKA